MTVPAGDAAFTRRLVEAAASPYQRVSGFAWRFARQKMTRDPLFATLLATGAIPDSACLVDLGCGQGLLALWIHAARRAWQSADAQGPWPAGWEVPPKVATYLGIDQSRRDIARAKPAMPPFARVFRGDVGTLGPSMLARCDVVTLFDVLHYLSKESQERLLSAMAGALPPWGVVVLRVGDGSSWSSRWADAVDLVVCALRGHPRPRLYRRPLASWYELFERNGFVVEVLHDDRAAEPFARSTHAFANVLLRASRAPQQAAA
jgi:Methyltransferase domain